MLLHHSDITETHFRKVFPYVCAGVENRTPGNPFYKKGAKPLGVTGIICNPDKHITVTSLWCAKAHKVFTR